MDSVRVGPLNAIELLLVLWQLGIAWLYLRRVVRARGAAPGIDAVFIGAWLVGALVLLEAGSIRPLANAALDSSRLPEFLREADARLLAVEELPAAVWEMLRGPFGWALDEEPPLRAIPLRGESSLEARIAPAVEDLLLMWARAGLWFSCATLLIASLLLRRAASTRALVHALEERVASLERELAGARGQRSGPSI